MCRDIYNIRSCFFAVKFCSKIEVGCYFNFHECHSGWYSTSTLKPDNLGQPALGGVGSIGQGISDAASPTARGVATGFRLGGRVRRSVNVTPHQKTEKSPDFVHYFSSRHQIYIQIFLFYFNRFPCLKVWGIIPSSPDTGGTISPRPPPLWRRPWWVS